MEGGEPVGTRRCLEELLEALEPYAARLGGSAPLRRAGELSAQNGAMTQRQVAADGGIHAVAAWLSERFLTS